MKFFLTSVTDTSSPFCPFFYSNKEDLNFNHYFLKNPAVHETNSKFSTNTFTRNFREWKKIYSCIVLLWLPALLVRVSFEVPLRFFEDSSSLPSSSLLSWKLSVLSVDSSSSSCCNFPALPCLESWLRSSLSFAFFEFKTLRN